MLKGTPEKLTEIKSLCEKYQDLLDSIDAIIEEKMPITTRTNSVRIKKEELIKKLEELEKAIDMFSRKQVFIKI